MTIARSGTRALTRWNNTSPTNRRARPMTDSPGFTITRTIAAPPEAVFDAWVTPESLATWWGGNQVDIPLDSLTLDARVGGKWKATLAIGNGMDDFHWYGEYLEVDRPNKLVMTMSDKPGDAREIF